MKIGEVRNRSNLELIEDYEKLRKELFDIRFQSATEQMDNPARIGDIRKTIARIRTVLNERKREGAFSETEDKK